MDIGATTPLGLTGTAQAIQRGQARFDAKAAQVTADTLQDAQPGADASSLASDLVGMQADAISNKILYAVFRRQQEQQGDLADLIKPKS